MSDYTPSLEEVRHHWTDVGFAGDGESFDRFLAQVRAEALREAAELMLDEHDGLPFDDDYDRAIPSAWLIEEAERIVRGEG